MRAQQQLAKASRVRLSRGLFCTMKASRCGNSERIPQDLSMTKSSARKLVGSLAVLVFVVIYTLAAMWFGATVVNPQSKWIHLVYYTVAGIGWAFPAFAIIKWSSKPAD